MNRLNPIYVLALVAVILFISFNMLFNIESEYNSAYKEKNSLGAKAQAFNEYKSRWFDKKSVEKRIDMLLKNSSFQNEKVLKVVNSNLIKIKIESKNQKILQTFLTRILNEKIMINKLQIEKDFISLEVGI